MMLRVESVPDTTGAPPTEGLPSVLMTEPSGGIHST